MAELVAITTLLVALAAGGFLATLLRMPPPLGYLAVGVASTTLGEELLPHSTVEALAEVGVLILLFWIGLELDLKRLREGLKKAAASAPFDILVPTLLVAGTARLFGWSVGQAFALGIAVAVSSTLFGERLSTTPGFAPAAKQRVVGVLVTEDVAAGALIAILVAVSGPGVGALDVALDIGRLLALLLLLAGLGLGFVPKILDGMARRHIPDLIVLWALALVAVFGLAGQWAGSAELGALLAGVAAAEAGSRYVTRNALHGLRDVAGAMFFFGAGLAVDLTELGGGMYLAAAIALVFVVAKTVVHLPAGVAGGLSLRHSLQATFALATLGEFSLILIAVAEGTGLAHPASRTVIIGAMLLLLPTASILVRSAPALEKAFWKIPEKRRRSLVWLGRGLQRERERGTDRAAIIDALRRFFANLVMLVTWGAVAFALQGPVTRLLGGSSWAAGAWLGLAGVIALPLGAGTYRAYRVLVARMVGVRLGDHQEASRVRSRIVDALAAFTTVLALVPVALILPQAVPVLAVGATLAAVIALVAWRGLSGFHAALEGNLTRVLGDDASAEQFLDQMLDRYPWGVRFIAVSVPPGSPVVGQTLLQTRLTKIAGATVAVLQRGRQETVNPPPSTELRASDTLVLVGDSHQLARAEALIVAHGDAVRMTAQTAAACIEEIPLTHASIWDKKTLGEVRIRETTGSLVIGVWEIGDAHPRPYDPDIVLDADDRLILLGTPLQLSRARDLATGESHA